MGTEFPSKKAMTNVSKRVIRKFYDSLFAEPVHGYSLLLTTKSLELFGTHHIDHFENDEGLSPA